MKNSSAAPFECGGWAIGDLLSVASSGFDSILSPPQNTGSAAVRQQLRGTVGFSLARRDLLIRRLELEAQAEKPDVSLIRPFPTIAEEN